MTPSKVRDDSCEFSFTRGQISSKHGGGGAVVLALHASVTSPMLLYRSSADLRDLADLKRL